MFSWAGANSISLSAPGGGEGRGEVGDSRALASAHLALPRCARAPSLSPLKGGEGRGEVGDSRALAGATSPFRAARGPLLWTTGTSCADVNSSTMSPAFTPLRGEEGLLNAPER